MGKEVKITSPVVDVLQEMVIDQESREFKAGLLLGNNQAYENIKHILSSARLPQDVKSQVWYLIDEAQKNKS